MPKNRYKNAPKSRKPQRHTPASRETAAPDAPPAPSPIAPVPFAIGLLALAVAIVASGMLALDHFEILKLPGCGAGSGCDKAAASKLGSISLGDTSWPTSFLGLAFFVAMAAAWIASRSGASLALKIMASLGALASVFYLSAMFTNLDSYFCKYCLASHAANFVFLAVLLLFGGLSRNSTRAIATAAVAFVASSTLLLGASAISDKMAIAKGEEQFDDSLGNLLDDTKSRAQNQPDTGTTAAATTTTPADPNAWKTDPRITHTGRRGFTGNYLWGPEQTKARIVVFSSYQCEDCRRVHDEIKNLLNEFGADVSFSHKHFPFAAPCNPAIDPNNPKHPNSCWAACAAEAAGILYGEQGFKTFHDWLFHEDVRGGFTDDVLKAKLASLGWDTQRFIQVMSSPETREIVRADVDEAIELGLFYTPMMFVNGVQIRGFRTPFVVTRAVRALLKENPQTDDATSDWPADRLDKYVKDFFDSGTNPRYGSVGNDRFVAARGPEDAPVTIQTFYCYATPDARQLDAMVQRAIAANPGKVRHVIRHFPVSKTCNPKILDSFEEGPNVCTMAALVEAAGQTYGQDAYFALHDLFLNLPDADDFDLESTLNHAASLGMDPETLQTAMESPQVQTAVQGDIQWLISVRKSNKASPFINGHFVPNWATDNLPVIETIVDEIAAR